MKIKHIETLRNRLLDGLTIHQLIKAEKQIIYAAIRSLKAEGYKIDKTKVISQGRHITRYKAHPPERLIYVVPVKRCCSIHLPKRVSKHLKITEGNLVQINMHSDGSVTITQRVKT